MAVTKLTFSGFSHHRIRMALTLLAIALSVSLVVAVTGGYASAEAAIFKYLSGYLGVTDIRLANARNPREGVPPALLAELRADPAVRTAVGRLETQLPLLDAEGNALRANGLVTTGGTTVIGVELPADYEVTALAMEPGTNGGWFQGNDGAVCVIDQQAAKVYQVGVGGVIGLKQMRLTVVGIVRKPQILASFQPTVYVPLGTLQKLVERPDLVTNINVDLAVGAPEEEFLARWRSRLATAYPQVRLRTARDSRRQMNEYLSGIRNLSYLGGTVSMLAATFIVFSTLSMGVTERQRTLAMLRAIGALRWQIGALVVLEGLVLASIGAAAGVPLGWLWIKLLAVMKPDIFTAGVVLSAGGIAFAAGGSIFTAMAASILPAWSAMRLKPMEAMTAVGVAPSQRLPIYAALTGLALLLVDPLLVWDFRPESWSGHALAQAVAGAGQALQGLVSEKLAFYLHFIIGLPCLMIGVFLLAPVVVWLVEKTLGRVLAVLMGIRHELLAQQMTASIWRAAGTAAALMVGLAILVVLQVSGNSSVKGWNLPTKFPDIFIVSPFGLKPDQLAQLEKVDGIRVNQDGRPEVLPFVVTFAKLEQGYFTRMLPAGLLGDSTMFLGIRPDLALEMMHLEFREGSAEEAVAKLKAGGHLVVTEEFRQLKGLTVGDKLKLYNNKNEMREYTIAGVVWSPGIDVFVTLYDMDQQFQHRSAGTVFGSDTDAMEHLGADEYTFFAANLEYGVEKHDLQERVAKQLGTMGMIYGDVRKIKSEIIDGFQKILLLVSTVALSAVLVAGLGVTNTIMASVRSRRWQMGILRSIGVTRLQVLRMILAEGLLLGVVGCVLGLGAGLLMAVNANELGGRTVGYKPPIEVPWDMVWLGIAVIMGAAFLASLWPAASAAREKPLALLQAGRAAA